MRIYERMKELDDARSVRAQEKRDAWGRKTRRVLLGLLVGASAVFVMEIGLAIWLAFAR